MNHPEPHPSKPETPTSSSRDSTRIIILIAVGLPLAMLVVVAIAAYVVFLTPWATRLLLGGGILLLGLLAIGVTTASVLRQFIDQSSGYSPAVLNGIWPPVAPQAAAPPQPGDSGLGQAPIRGSLLATSPQIPAEVELEALRTEFNRFSPTPFEVITVHEKIKLLHPTTRLAGLFGYEPGEIAGLTLLDLTTPEVHGAVLQRILSKYDQPYEVMGRRKGGDTFPLELLSQTLFHQGQTFRVMGLREIAGEKWDEMMPSMSKTIAELEGEVKKNTTELRYANERLRLELNARQQTEETLKERNRELTILQSAIVAITSRLDLRYVLDTVSQEMTRLPGVESCTIFEWKPVENLVVKVAEYRPDGWWDSQSRPEIHLLTDYPLLKSVLEEQVPEQMSINQPFVDPDEIVRMKEAGVKSRLFLPMVFQQHVLGLVRLENSQVEQVFSYQEIALAKLLANQAASAIENARLFEQAQEEIKERQQAEAALEQERARLAERVKERTAELSRANSELARASRHKDEFLASMSHELRTPLNAILGSAEILQSQVFGPLQEKQAKYVKNVDESGRHLLALINDILDLSKIEAGKMELTIRPVSIHSICESSMRLVKEMAHKKQIRLQEQLNTIVTILPADERRLKQILVNLLSNAVKFTPEGGQVGLEVNEETERQIIHFTVWDTGIGIAQEDMSRLFQPFVQLDSALSRQYAGTGLGLSLVSRMVEMHGGGISVASEAGQGSRFTVSFPYSGLAETAEAPQETAPIPEAPDVVTPSPSEPPAAPLLVLLAEDNEAAITMVTDYLEFQRFRVVIARNGNEALERSLEEKPDIILMDSQMPEMDGLEATRRVRTTPHLASIPIIMMTALAMPGDRERGLAAGANEYFSKPINLQELVKIIKAYLA